MIIHDVKQNTPEWEALHAGKPTSSAFGSLITGYGKEGDGMEEYAYQLAAEKHAGTFNLDGFAGNKFTRRGHEMEPESRSWYEMQFQAPVTEVGFITNDLMTYGASTDGLVGDDGAVEFKNLIGKEFVKLLVYMARNKGNTPPGYIPQVQGELLVTGRKWCDLVFYHPSFEPVVKRYMPDKKYQAILEKQIMKVIAKRNEILKLIGD